MVTDIHIEDFDNGNTTHVAGITVADLQSGRLGEDDSTISNLQQNDEQQSLIELPAAFNVSTNETTNRIMSPSRWQVIR